MSLQFLKAASTLPIFLAFSVFSCVNNQNSSKKNSLNPTMSETTTNEQGLQVATFANGCFWCTEAIFSELKGVQKVVSGYTGGTVENPTYKEVCNGTTGHAECLQITYDSSLISFTDLLEVFWQTHDPTTLNKQGADEGTQYRSGIFYHNSEQKDLAEEYKKRLDDSGAFTNPIVTEITPFEKFYAAEDYHQSYYELNGETNPYCRIVIQPKVEKFRKVFADKLKK